MAALNPKQIEYIKSIQPDFEFRVRKLQPSLDVASEDDLFKVDMSLPNLKPMSLARQGSLQAAAGVQHVTRRFDNPIPTATLRPLSDASIPQPHSLTVEDRRLLARAKWLLKRLLMEDDDELDQRRPTITDELDEHEEGELLESKSRHRKGCRVY